MLRQNWEKAKSEALKEFKKHAPIKLGTDPHVNAPPAFPITFGLKLGPVLDEFEKEKRTEKRNVLAGKAVGIIGRYATSVDHEKNNMGNNAAAILSGCLKQIRAHIQHEQGQNHG